MEAESGKRKRKVEMVVESSCTRGKTGIGSLMSMFKHELQWQKGSVGVCVCVCVCVRERERERE